MEFLLDNNVEKAGGGCKSILSRPKIERVDFSCETSGPRKNLFRCVSAFMIANDPSSFLFGIVHVQNRNWHIPICIFCFAHFLGLLSCLGPPWIRIQAIAGERRQYTKLPRRITMRYSAFKLCRGGNWK